MTDTLTSHPRGQLGQGIYSLADLRGYLGYFGQASDAEHALDWLAMLNPVAHVPRQPDYSFSDLVSLFVVRELLRLGVKPRKIREAEKHMRTVRIVDRPFVFADVATDGRDVFFDNGEPGQIESANRGGGQQASHHVMAPYLRSVRYSDEVDGVATAWSPTDHVVLNPQIQFGEPVVDGTRVQTAALAEIVASAGLAQASEWLGVPLASARAAVSFERRLAALRN
jgi:uncharacterized protein (DUF433 family)